MSTKESSSKNDYSTFGRKQVEVEGVGNGHQPRTMERSSSLDSIQTTSLVAVPESGLESNGSHPPKTRYFLTLFVKFSRSALGCALKQKLHKFLETKLT